MPSINHTGITVSTAIVASGIQFNHAEGVVVSTPIVASGISLNHAEGLAR